VLPLERAARIYRRARDLGLEIVLTVYDSAGIDFALDAGAAALKIASSNVTHAPLIREVARRGKPVIVDTGRATHEEIGRAVEWARAAGARELIVQHSPAAPPAPLEQHHLRMMRALGERFDCPYGLSDHHAGNEMLLAAVALGASVVEKGIAADDARADIDLAHAARIGEVAGIVRAIDAVWRALGEEAPQRAASRATDRMGLVAARALRAGEKIEASSARFAMALPEGAVPVERWDEVQGRRLARAVAADQPIRWEDLAAGG
jgi:sialic acid synthase SpsE